MYLFMSESNKNFALSAPFCSFEKISCIIINIHD